MPISLSDICNMLAIREDVLKSTSRVWPVQRSRMLACYLLRRQGWTYKRIGDALNRHHAAVLKAVRNIERAIEVGDKRITSELKNLERFLEYKL